jgi:hypothetical protein
VVVVQISSSLSFFTINVIERPFNSLTAEFEGSRQILRMRTALDSESIESLLLPTSVEDTYEKILTRVLKTQEEVVNHIVHMIWRLTVP